MKWKSTLVLLVATVAVGMYLSLYELKQPSPELRERRARQVVRLDPNDVQRVVLETSHGAIALVRAAQAWRLETPPVRADGALIDGLLRDLRDMERTRTLTVQEDEAMDPALYGLDPPQARFIATTPAGPIEVRFGAQTPVGDSRYVQVAGDRDIHVVVDGLYDSLEEPLETFRDHRLLRFNSWETEECVVKAPTAEWRLVRRGGEWELSQPVADRADRAEVGGWLSRLSGMQIQRFLTDEPASDLAAWGLDEPTMEITLAQPEGQRTTMRVGDPVPDDETLVAVQRSDEPSIYAVKAEDVEALRRDPQDLRSRAALEFFTGQVNQAALTTAQTAWTITREGSDWTDADTGAALETERVEEFLNALADLRLAGFEDDAPGDLAPYGLEDPEATIEIWAGSQAPRRLLVGTAIRGSAERYGRIEGRAPVVRLPEEINDLLGATLERFTPPEDSGAGADQLAGAQDALDDGGVGQDGQGDEGPPE